MKPIDHSKVKIKNLIGIVENPTLEDLLFEIVSFLDNERRYESEFKTHEAFLKTRTRLSDLLSEDLDQLAQIGYLEKLKYSNYRVIKHLWEKTI
jgi:hypothetical protein